MSEFREFELGRWEDPGVAFTGGAEPTQDSFGPPGS